MLVRAEFRNLGQPHAPARQGSLLRPASSVADAGHLGECGMLAAMAAAVGQAWGGCGLFFHISKPGN